MNWMTSLLVAVALVLPIAQSHAVSEAEASIRPDVPLPFYVYKNFRARENHFTPSGWMGDHGDIRFTDNWAARNAKEDTAIRVEYTAQGRQGAGWAGIYWQHPANNWGSKQGGFNLNGATKVSFIARGEKGGETIDQFKVGGMGGDFADSGAAALGPVSLTKDWKRYEISLEGQELSSISGGFCWALNRDQNPKGAIFYLDDIRYE